RYCLCRNRSFLTQKPGFRNSPIRKGGRATLLYHNTVPYSMSPFTDLRTGSDTFSRMGHDFGYARVSTGDQDARLQHDALTAAGSYRIFTDAAAGSLESRPALDKLLERLRHGDTLAVWRLARLGRPTRRLTDPLAGLQERGVEFRSLQENIDTSSSGRRLIFHIFASLAEFERDLIRERTKAGLEAARARGRTGGRPPPLSGDKLRPARKLYEQKDMTVAQIGEVLGVSRTTVYRALRKETGVLPTRQKDPSKST